MKKALIISSGVILVVVIGFLGYLLADTRSELSSAKNNLDAKISELVSLTSKLEQSGTDLKNTTEELSKINDDLDETISTLALTKQELNNAKNELDSTKTELSVARTEMNELNTQFFTTKSSFDSINTSLENAIKDLESANTTIEQLNKDIDLYNETFGEVHGSINPPLIINDVPPPTWAYRIYEGHVLYDKDIIESPPQRQVKLINNTKAKNPSYNQLIEFLEKDKTDTHRYVSDYYDCGNFAETLHNNAEAAGIRAAFVIVTFEIGPSQALNAFITYDKDQKLLYIDCTGYGERVSPTSMDSSVPYLKLGSNYWRNFLFPSSNRPILTPEDNKVTSIKIYW